jgi:CRISPR-associated protein (TIGR03986 family)
MTQYIKAPFNFVPLNEKVFFPNWAEQVSHDIPFEDGESGTIELELTAMTPIFVRNGHTKADAEAKNENYTSFSKDNEGNYFIPGTSVKGMIRNVLEIMSFGKMNQVSNDRYSIRDLQSKKYISAFQNADIHCGWMKKSGWNKIEISDHGIPRRISHQDIDMKWGTDFSKKFKNAGLLKADENRTAFYKINLAKNKDLKGNFIELPLNPENALDKRIKVKFDDNGNLKGTIVFTGQPSARKDKGDIDRNGYETLKGTGKCYEFVFPDSTSNAPFTIDINEEFNLFKDFCFVHKDSIDWKYWKQKFEKGDAVPVFFSLSKSELLHFGLSYLYKLPFKNRIKDFLPKTHTDTRPDLSECVFGKISRNEASKGRIQFSNMKLLQGNSSKILYKPYMGSPKPTYYPIYLVQEGNDGLPNGEFTTMLSNSAKLKGWKRYPVHEQIAPFKIPDGDHEEHLNPFYPIESGSIFTGKINVHNLRKAEIGALIQSINFNNSGFHSIGFAKAYGFGRVKIGIKLIKGFLFSKDEYAKSFRELMETEIPNYSKSRELKELNVMSSPQNTTSTLEYMDLKDFVECKKQNTKKNISGEYLEYYSELIVQKVSVQPENLEVEAEITFFQKPLIKAKLLEGKDTLSKPLRNFPNNQKLKPGDRIMVKKIVSGGNIKELEFYKIIKR